MKNVTITLDEEVARWARITAAGQNTSVSRLVGELLREKMIAEQNYQISMQQYLSRPINVLKLLLKKLPDAHPKRLFFDGRNQSPSEDQLSGKTRKNS